MLHFAKHTITSKLRIIIIGLVFFSLTLSCNRDDVIIKNIDLENPDKSYLRITNNSKKNSHFSISINGKSVYSDEMLVNFIIDNMTGSSNAEKVWRFISLYSQNKQYNIPNAWNMDPLIQINSSGGGDCGFQSAAMVNILILMDEIAKAWCIEGHVIVEALVNNQWQVFDPFLGVIYHNEDGTICSYEQLCKDPYLVHTPYNLKNITNHCDSLQATFFSTAFMYSTKEDNRLFNVDYPNRETYSNIVFELPPRASLDFPVIIDRHGNYTSVAVLNVPPQWTGIINIPLILYDIDGDAEVYYSNQLIKPGQTQIEEIIVTLPSETFLNNDKNMPVCQ